MLYTILHGWGAPVQVSGGVAGLVQNNGIVKSEPKYLACEKYVLSTFELFLVLLSLSWLYGGLTYLLFSESPAGLHSALVYALCSANTCVAKGHRTVLLVLCRQVAQNTGPSFSHVH